MDFIRIAGPAAEGVIMASGPVMSPETQPDSALTKKPGLALNTAYEAKYGANSRSQFAGHSYDAFEVLKRVMPVALKTAQAGHAGIPRGDPPGAADREAKSRRARASTTSPKRTATASTTARASS